MAGTDIATPTGSPGGVARLALLLSWLVGFAMLAGVVLVALHWSEERALVRLAAGARPWWMAVATALQACTYLAQGQIWRLVGRQRGELLPLGQAARLSLAKLFIDQALPSAGISGTLVVARGLEQRGMARTVVMAAMVVDGVAYYAAYVVALIAALLLPPAGRSTWLFLPAALFLAAFSMALGATALALSSRRAPAPGQFRRVPLLRNVVALLAEADPALVRSPALLLKCTGLQLAVVLLDAATLWTLIVSLGGSASPLRVYASFMASSLLRTVSVVPGGLGVFEAASVATLRQSGATLPVALGATLLFRGLSFWLPMVPGLWFARPLRRRA